MVDYEAIVKKQLISNILDLRKELEHEAIPDDVKQKINNFSSKFCINREYIYERLKWDDLFALHFIKEPGRQSLHENAAYEFLTTIPWILNPIKLNKSGPEAMYVSQGHVIKRSEVTSNKTSKSIDFFWLAKDNMGTVIECYATHKYTKDEGGAQNNQFKDAEDFLSNASVYTRKDRIFIAILDGPYYKRQFKKNKQAYSSRIQYLNQEYKTANNSVYAITIDELINFNTHLNLINAK